MVVELMEDNKDKVMDKVDKEVNLGDKVDSLDKKEVKEVKVDRRAQEVQVDKVVQEVQVDKEDKEDQEVKVVQAKVKVSLVTNKWLKWEVKQLRKKILQQ